MNTKDQQAKNLLLIVNECLLSIRELNSKLTTYRCGLPFAIRNPGSAALWQLEKSFDAGNYYYQDLMKLKSSIKEIEERKE